MIATRKYGTRISRNELRLGRRKRGPYHISFVEREDIIDNKKYDSNGNRGETDGGASAL